jgi:hypothetical protein
VSLDMSKAIKRMYMYGILVSCRVRWAMMLLVIINRKLLMVIKHCIWLIY